MQGGPQPLFVQEGISYVMTYISEEAALAAPSLSLVELMTTALVDHCHPTQLEDGPRISLHSSSDCNVSLLILRFLLLSS